MSNESCKHKNTYFVTQCTTKYITPNIFSKTQITRKHTQVFFVCNACARVTETRLYPEGITVPQWEQLNREYKRYAPSGNGDNWIEVSDG